MLDLLSKLAKFALDLVIDFQEETNRITYNIVLWLAFYFRGYEARIGAILGGLLVVLLILFIYLWLSLFSRWNDFTDGEVLRQPGRAKSASSWFRRLIIACIWNGIWIYLIGHFIWNILRVLRYLPFY